MRLVGKAASGPGEARALHVSGTEHRIEYAEPGHLFWAVWDPRETDVFLPVFTQVWDEPEGAPIDDAARERVHDGLWRAGQLCGVRAVLETLQAWSLFIPVRWDRGSEGFLLNVHDSDKVDYMELGRVVRLPYTRNDQPLVKIVQPPADPRWDHPAGQPIDPAHFARILDRVARATSKDMWYGRHLTMHLRVARP